MIELAPQEAQLGTVDLAPKNALELAAWHEKRAKYLRKLHEVERQRDELLDALQTIVNGNKDPDVMVQIAIDAIAKFKGGAV